MNNTKYFISSFGWTTLSKVTNAVLKFISIPLLISYFGKNGYGLITLALSINAYMQLMDMGMNTGMINYFSKWIKEENFSQLNKVFRSNLTFYSILGLVNAFALILLTSFGESIFNITKDEFVILKDLLLVLAGLSIFNWISFAFSQILIANEKIAFTQQVLLIKSILSLLNVFLTLFFQWSISEYLICEAFINSLILVPYFLYTNRLTFITSICPGWYWKDFKVVFYYGLAIFAMSIFQFSASQSRPLILASFANGNVTGLLSDYKILEVFPVFILSIGGAMISIFLPKTSRALADNNKKTIEKLAYTGTMYTSVIVAILCFPIIINAADLLDLYVGNEYRDLSIWLIIWIATLVSYLYNSPVSSLVLSTGRTKILVISSAFSCIISIVFNAVFTDKIGVGSAVLGYSLYIFIQMCFYYLYFNNKVLGLNSWIVFKSFLKPTIVAIFTAFIVVYIPIETEVLPINIIVKSFLWLTLFLLSLYFTKILDFKNLFINFKNR